MLIQRLLVVAVLAPVVVALIVLGGWAYTALIALALGLAAWEFWRMFRQGGYAPSAVVLIGGTVLMVLLRAWQGFTGGEALLSFLTLIAMGVHVFHYERGIDKPASDFVITVGGIVYVGWLGSYLISLRNLNDGLWWMLLVLPAVWFADSGAFFIGRRFGRHKLAPRCSPHKSWEGYLGGVASAALLSAALAAVWQNYTPAITPLRGLLVGVVIAILTPLGDLGESMLKRQFGVKDTSRILPGHGGILDRIDSWLWAVIIGYYLIVWFW